MEIKVKKHLFTHKGTKLNKTQSFDLVDLNNLVAVHIKEIFYQSEMPG